MLGLIRDVVRFVQEARKDAGLDVTDRIELAWQVGGSPEPAEAIRAHEQLLPREVLARAARTRERRRRRRPDWARRHENDDDLGLRIWLRRVALIG